eukprot:198714-Chlamydomonas_euryale.AAC.4
MAASSAPQNGAAALPDRAPLAAALAPRAAPAPMWRRRARPPTAPPPSRPGHLWRRCLRRTLHLRRDGGVERAEPCVQCRAPVRCLCRRKALTQGGAHGHTARRVCVRQRAPPRRLALRVVRRRRDRDVQRAAVADRPRVLQPV